jgi:hypothetical protein
VGSPASYNSIGPHGVTGIALLMKLIGNGGTVEKIFQLVNLSEQSEVKNT